MKPCEDVSTDQPKTCSDVLRLTEKRAISCINCAAAHSILLRCVEEFNK